MFLDLEFSFFIGQVHVLNLNRYWRIQTFLWLLIHVESIRGLLSFSFVVTILITFASASTFLSVSSA